MGYGLTVFRADLDELRWVAGSNHPDWLLPFGGVVGWEPDDDPDRLDPSPLTWRQAFQEIVRGRITGSDHDRNSAAYGYALEEWCWDRVTQGKAAALDNGQVVSLAWFGLPPEQKAALKPLIDLAEAGAPIRIPRPEDFPVIGHMEAGAVPAKLARFEALAPRGHEGWTRPVMEQYGSWLREAAVHRQGLMTFTH